MLISDHVTCLGNRHFNYFLIGQEAHAIVECGVSGGVYSLNRELARLGLKPDIHYLLVSHAHFDHVCGVPALQERFPQAKVIASAEAKRILAKSKVLQNFFAQDEKMSMVLHQQGMIPALAARTIPATIAVDTVISAGESLDLPGGLQLQAIDAQGHSPCGLAFYLPQDRVMFVADCGGFQIRNDFLFPIFFQSYELYIETLHRLRGYKAQAVAIPHERLWFGQDVTAFFDRAISQAQSAFQVITAMLDMGMDDTAISDQLFTRYYVDDLQIYTPENIRICVELLIRRVKECL